MLKLPVMYGMMVFSDHVMKHRLPKDIYEALQETIQDGSRLDVHVADVVAEVMKDWAVELGATHYTHWFQPMTGITAEKHVSFISPTPDGRVIMEFSGGELIKGESDASSFPSGGLRATFEARGYTAWDPTSFAFVKDGTLFIPTAYCSHTGEALDQKTPLLRSMEALNVQALRILRLFGNLSVKRVLSTTGPEQEYFLLDKKLYDMRKDLIYTGRTLFGASPPKGQELDDHYFGNLTERISAYMKEVDEELWKLGICAKTKHNESAPSQHELATIYTTSNIAADHNQVTMEVLKKVAKRHGLVCLLHEKPFAGVNGSGKHNNWSIEADDGTNLFEPGDSPNKNAQFMLLLCSVVKAVDEHQDILRLSVATAGNDVRLGGSEAPPAIISIYLGEQLTGILEAISAGVDSKQADHELFELGVRMLPKFPKDTTDRNRTSPIAFTGNKFEFRMVGSSMSVSMPNVMFNTIVAEALSELADYLEKSGNPRRYLNGLIRETYQKHKRVVFNGNNYSGEWEAEAKGRDLLVLKTAVEAIPHLISEKNIGLFEKHGVFSRSEIVSRYEIMLENYAKTVNIEALTMAQMAKKQIMPAVIGFTSMVSGAYSNKKSCGLNLNDDLEAGILAELSDLGSQLSSCVSKLNSCLTGKPLFDDKLSEAEFFCNDVIPLMDRLRSVSDKLECIVGKEFWPFPTYGDLLYNNI